MNKRVSISAKPNGSATPAIEDWVSHREISEPVQELKRLTIDIPKSLHTAIKTSCATRGTKMADEIRELLGQHYSPTNETPVAKPQN